MGQALSSESQGREEAESRQELPEVAVRVVRAELDRYDHAVVYQIALMYRGSVWTISRRYSQLSRLHAALAPVLRDLGLEERIVPPPKTIFAVTDAVFVEQRRQALQKYLANLCALPSVWRAAPAAMYEFFEISMLSFGRALGRKGKEGWLWKRPGGYRLRPTPTGALEDQGLFMSWRRRWFVLKDCAIVYFSSPEDETPRGAFTVGRGFRAGRWGGHTRQLRVTSPSRWLILAADSDREATEWLEALTDFYSRHRPTSSLRRAVHQGRSESVSEVTGAAGEAIVDTFRGGRARASSSSRAGAEPGGEDEPERRAGGSAFEAKASARVGVSHTVPGTVSEDNPLGCFAPARAGTRIVALATGREYFASVARAMLDARSQIFIAGWWVDPYVELVRPARESDRAPVAAGSWASPDVTDEPDRWSNGSQPLRLVDLLRVKAMQGVKISVLMYAELESAGLVNASARAAARLAALHPRNISVIRHPVHTPAPGRETGFCMAYSHHEKLVVVDQVVAFVGGIDLAPGRYCDEDRVGVDPRGEVWRGWDLHNPAIASSALRAELSGQHVAPVAPELAEGPASVLTEGIRAARLGGAAATGAEARKQEKIVARSIAQHRKMVLETMDHAGTSFDALGEVDHHASDREMTKRRRVTLPDDRTDVQQRVGSRSDLAAADDDSARGSPPPGVVASGAASGDDADAAADAAHEEESAALQSAAAASSSASSSSASSSSSSSSSSASASSPSPGTPFATPPRGVDSRGPTESEARGGGGGGGVGGGGVGGGLLSPEARGWASDVHGSAAAKDVLAGGVSKEDLVLSRGGLDPLWHPRMPWADAAVAVGPPAALDVAFHFIERWNHHRLTTQAMDTPVLIPFSDASEWWSGEAEEFGPRPGFSRGLRDAVCDARRVAAAAGAGLSLGPREAGDIAEAEINAETFAHGGGAAQGALEAGRAREVAARLLLVEARMRISTAASCAPEFHSLLARPSPAVSLAARSEIEAVTADTPHWRPSRARRPADAEEEADAAAADAAAASSPTSSSSSSSPPPPSSSSRASSTPVAHSVSDLTVEGWAQSPPVPFHGPFALRIVRGRKWEGAASAMVLRSVGPWSLGVPSSPEMSVALGIASAIRHAEKFVYIETQFFVSSTAEHGVLNAIGATLRDRLHRAMAARERFRAILVLPSHPEGDPTNSIAMRAVLHYQLWTLVRGPSSLLGSLRRAFPDVNLWDYVCLASLRTASWVPGEGLAKTLVTEQVYVHSKVVIVDDRVAVVGSANINDRSLQGDRDSEVCVMYSGGPREGSAGRMDGHAFPVSSIVRNLRVRLWRMHLGLNRPARSSMEMVRRTFAESFNPGLRRPASSSALASPDAAVHALLADPVCDETYHGLWMHSMLHNTRYYERVFPGTAQFTSYEFWRRDLLPPEARLAPLPDLARAVPVAVSAPADRTLRAAQGAAAADAELAGLALPFRAWHPAWDKVPVPVSPHIACYSLPIHHSHLSSADAAAAAAIAESVAAHSADDPDPDPTSASASSSASASASTPTGASGFFAALARTAAELASPPTPAKLEAGDLVRLGVYFRPPVPAGRPPHSRFVHLPLGIADPDAEASSDRDAVLKPVGFLVWGSLAFMLGTSLEAPMLSGEAVVGRYVFQ